MKKIIIPLSFILFCLIISCDKSSETDCNTEQTEIDDYVWEHFFEEDFISSTNGSIINSASNLKNLNVDNEKILDEIFEYYNNNLEHVQITAERLGFPIWDRCKINKFGENRVAIIPLSYENSVFTNGLLIVFSDKDNPRLLFDYIARNKFEKYPEGRIYANEKLIPSKDYIISLFLYFDKLIFNYSDCNLLSSFKKLLSKSKLKSMQMCNYDIIVTQNEHYYKVEMGDETRYEYNYSTIEYEYTEYCRNINEPIADIPDTGMPIGPGGSGEPDGNTPPNKLDPTDTPCDQISKITTHSSFLSKMNSLKHNTRLVVETAYLMRGTQSGPDMFSYEYQQSDMNTPGYVDLDLRNGSIDGYIHSHRYGDSPIFSIDDVQAIYLAYKAGKINDLRTFTAGVVTADGTTYLVNINNKEAFIEFGDKYLTSKRAMGDLDNEYMFIFNNDDPSLQKISLMGALVDAGIYLFEGNVDNFKIWNRQAIGSNGMPINSNCND